MSVINQMLKDLDNRQHQPQTEKTAYPKIDDGAGIPENNAKKKFALGFALLVLMALALTWSLDLFGLKPRLFDSGTAPETETRIQAPVTQIPKKLEQAAKTDKKNLVLAQQIETQALSTAGQSEQSELAFSQDKAESTAQLTNNQTAEQPDPLAQSKAQTINAAQPSVQTTQQSEPVKSLQATDNKPTVQPKQTQPVSDNRADAYLAIQPTQESSEDIAKTRLNQAKALLNKGQFVQAEQLLQTALSLDPQLHSARITLMSIRYGEQNYPAALAILQQGIQAYPEHLPYRLLAGQILLEINQPQVAWNLIKTQTPEPALNTQFYQFKASLAQQLEYWSSALENWQILLELSPNQAKWQLGAAISAEKNQLIAQAITHYQTALNLGGLSPASQAFAQQKIVRLTP